MNAILAVPNCCTENNTSSNTYEEVSHVRWDLKHERTMDMGIISLLTDGFAMAIPPTALVTETAGVNIPSAIVKLDQVSDEPDQYS